MKIFLHIMCLFCCTLTLCAQEGFNAFPNKKKVSIPFKLINNLVIIPVSVNGVELSFLLDTGVEETILFSLDEKEEVQLYNVEKLKLKGLGSQDAIEGLKSKKNTLTVAGLNYKDQEIYIVIDELMNLSSSLGIPVNGIIGYQLFKNNPIKINYSAKRLTIYNSQKNDIETITKKFTPFDITLERSKPYIMSSVTVGDEIIQAKLLLDTGNSDAIWLFDNRSEKVVIPSKNFDDFLGRGFSGPIFGKKARISDFSLNNYKFKNPVAAFPDTISLRNVKMVNNRLGSIGGEVFKRFQVIFDYQNNKIYLKKNGNFNMPFHCNTTGIEFHHVGLQWVPEEKKENQTSSSIKFEFGGGEMDVKYKFELKPIYEIASIRKDSPADKIGLKQGDVLISINNSESYKYSLQQINDMLKSEDGRNLWLEIERNDTILKFKLQMKSIL